MGRFALFLTSVILLAASQASAVDDVMTKAVKLYEKRHYDEAAGLLRSGAASLGSAKQGSANLALGMIYFKNAVLHRELYLASAWASQDYLKKLSALRGSSRSRFVDLYMGDALIEVGKADVAAIYLRQFLAGEGLGPQNQAIAQVSLGLSYQMNNEVAKGALLWAVEPRPRGEGETGSGIQQAGLTITTRSLAEDSLSLTARKAAFHTHGEEPSGGLCTCRPCRERPGPDQARRPEGVLLSGDAGQDEGNQFLRPFLAG
jgi:hypothetical protein